MFKDLIIIPNFFDNPEEIVKIAKSEKYYTSSEHPQDKDTNIYYGGYRSEKLSKHNDGLLRSTFFEKVLLPDVPKESVYDIGYTGSSYFHYFTETYTGGKSELHLDSALMAGVIYLNNIVLEKPENHGTIIFNKNNDRFVMPYTYNTLIFYRSDYLHAPLAGFGDSLDNARLSLVFTLSNLNINIYRNTL
jgi:hypothetical protein